MRSTTIATAINTTIRTAAGVIALAAAAANPASADDFRTIQFGKAGNWVVTGVHDPKGFNHCAARVAYQSGIQLGLLGYFNGGWSVQFHHKDWPERPASTFDVRIDVDGRTVLSGKGEWNGRSAFTYINGQDHLAALMNGAMMTVTTESGNTQFRLNGSSAAIRLVSTCRQRELAANPRRDGNATAGNGAFGPPAGRQPNTGAFGSPATASQPRNSTSAPPSEAAKPTKLSRAETISYADAYLRRRGLSVDLLNESGNILKFFPLNWKASNGIIGGAMVLRGATLTPAAAADRLLKEQSSLCKGTLGATNRAKTALPGGSEVELASARCSDAPETYSIVFQVSKSSDGMLVVIAEMAPHAANPVAGAVAPAATEL